MHNEKTIFRDRDDLVAEDLRGSMSRLAPDDRIMLHRIADAGGALDQPTHIIAYSYFLSGEDATAAQEQLMTAFGHAKIRNPTEEDESWCVVAETMACLAPPNIQAMHDFCSAVAERFRGEYDGWEAAIVKTNASRRYAWFTRLRRLFSQFTRNRSTTSSETTFYKRNKK